MNKIFKVTYNRNLPEWIRNYPYLTAVDEWISDEEHIVYWTHDLFDLYYEKNHDWVAYFKSEQHYLLLLMKYS